MQYEEIKELLKEYKSKKIIVKYFIDKKEAIFAYKDKNNKLGYGHYLRVPKEIVKKALDEVEP